MAPVMLSPLWVMTMEESASRPEDMDSSTLLPKTSMPMVCMIWSCSTSR